MRASIRGSIRSEMVTDSEVSALPATAASIRRRSGLFSAQKLRLGLFAVEDRHFFPFGNRAHLLIATTDYSITDY